jgi:hypothetical protein
VLLKPPKMLLVKLSTTSVDPDALAEPGATTTTRAASRPAAIVATMRFRTEEFRTCHCFLHTLN